MRLLYKTGPMESLRKWFYKPKRDDRSLLAQFYFADEALNMIAAELDSFDGRKDPERCTTLVNQLRHAQDRVLNITSQIMDQVLGSERVARGFRVKFPEDVLQDNLAGQLWFGAECLAAGSSIMNHEDESAAMRPLAKALTRSLETVRALLREQCLRPRNLALSEHDDMLHESLRIFDRLFAEFELCYVSAMVNVKTPHEFEAQQLICVLFSESLGRALRQGLLTQEQVDAYDPALMFAVPRLAIVNGLLVYSNGPLSIDKPPNEMSDMFRPFRSLLHKIRSLLWTLDRRELTALERLLCTNEDIANLANVHIPTENSEEAVYPDIGEFVNQFYADHENCRDLYTAQPSVELREEIAESDYLPDNIEVMTPIIEGLRRLGNDLEDLPETDNEEDVTIPHSSQAQEDNNPDTFQESEERDEKENKSRKTSKSEPSELASLRNLSTNGLMMFDPLVINAVAQENPRQIPDQNLVTSLNEQVTEIADRLSSIVTNDAEPSLEHNQIHSFSTNDVPTLISDDSTELGFQASRSEQLGSLPSTSHGYLIPNAISQEPVVLASLSHNNSAVFNQEEDGTDIHNAILNSELPLIMTDNIDTDRLNTNVSRANANLSSLLLTDDEYRQNFPTTTEGNEERAVESSNDDKVKFMLGYESDHHREVSPGDSGVSTENTSLDRSPDADLAKDIEKDHFLKQNRVFTDLDDNVDDDEMSIVENPYSEMLENVQMVVDDDQDVVVCNERPKSPDTQSNRAISCRLVLERAMEEVNDNRSHKVKESIELRRARILLQEEVERITSLQQWGIEVPDEDYRTLEEGLAEFERIREEDITLNIVSELFQTNANMEAPNTSHADTSSRQRKTKSTKTKKKKKMWSPGRVILDNRASQNQNTPLKLDLDKFVDESGTSCGVSECADDEEIALALQAQELAARQQARSKFKSSEDLIHRLYVCIAGVADQLQTNFAADLRNILKSVFLMNQTPDKPELEEEEDEPEVPEPLPEPETTPPENRKTDTIEYEATEQQVIQNGSSYDSVYSAEEVYADSNSDSANSENGSKLVRRNTVNSTTLGENHNDPTTSNESRRKSIDMSNLQSSVSTGDLTEYRDERRNDVVERAPEWVPDIAAPDCMRCSAHFTAFRRRHHCRNCGKVFCASCSSNSMPLPRFGQPKPVRVCDECFTNIAQHCRRGASTNQSR